MRTRTRAYSRTMFSGSKIADTGSQSGSSSVWMCFLPSFTQLRTPMRDFPVEWLPVATDYLAVLLCRYCPALGVFFPFPPLPSYTAETMPRPIAYNRSQSLQSPNLRNCWGRIRKNRGWDSELSTSELRDRSSVSFRAWVLGG